MKYYSEKTKQLYDTKKDLDTAESKYDAEMAKKEELAKARTARAKEIEEQVAKIREERKKLNEMINAFNKDYGAYHTSIKNVDELFDNFMSFWF